MGYIQLKSNSNAQWLIVATTRKEKETEEEEVGEEVALGQYTSTNVMDGFFCSQQETTAITSR